MTRDDALVWLSLAWFVTLCGAAIWAIFALCERNRYAGRSTVWEKVARSAG
jgi:hypothetical protein